MDLISNDIDKIGLPPNWYLDSIPLIAPCNWLAVYDGPGQNVIELHGDTPREVARMAWAVDRALRECTQIERLQMALDRPPIKSDQEMS